MSIIKIPLFVIEVTNTSYHWWKTGDVHLVYASNHDWPCDEPSDIDVELDGANTHYRLYGQEKYILINECRIRGNTESDWDFLVNNPSGPIIPPDGTYLVGGPIYTRCEAKANTLSSTKIVVQKMANQKQKFDNVHHPAHYTRGKIEVIEFIEDQQFEFHEAQIIKYVARAGFKNPATRIEDLEKAMWYLQRKIEILKSV